MTADITPEDVARQRTVIRLRDGVVEREKRWQGDTHDDLGGWVDYDATDTLMNDAADMLEALAARVAELEADLCEMQTEYDHENREVANWKVRAEAAEAKLAASEARVERLREAATSLRDIIRRNIVQKPGPATVETPDGKVHTGPLAEYMHDLLPMIADVLDRAALEGDKP